MNGLYEGAAKSLLFTDLYQLTMAQVYLRLGIGEARSQFDVFFRRYPDYGEHQAGYCVFAGLDDLLAWMAAARLHPDDEARLRTMRDGAGGPLFDDAFFRWLREQEGMPGLTLRTVAEGRVIHAGTPYVVAEAPLGLAQLIETPVLNHLNYPTLIATRAARLRHAARGGSLLDFGMRRGPAHAVDPGTRAALIGGVDASSNTGISLRLGVPPRGTHAHSLVQAIIALGGSELDAFRAYAEVYPDDCLLLLDTVDTLGSGLPNAITVFEELRAAGHEPRGVRLDSGDLAFLSIRVAAELDGAGFKDTTIALSNQLDELTIWQILQQIEEEAPSYGIEPARLVARMAYGVGTRLITSRGDSALDGVYKLVAMERDGAWEPSSKQSDTPSKSTTPGPKALHRVYDERGRATADLVTVADERPTPDAPLHLHHPTEEASRTLEPSDMTSIEALHEVGWADGARRVPELEIAEARARREADEERLDPGVRRLMNPHIYHVSLSSRLARLKRGVTASEA